MRTRTSPLFLLLLAAAPVAAAQEEPSSLERLLGSARAATAPGGTRPTLQLSGTTEKNGLPASFRWTLAPEGFFLRELRGRFPERAGYDGRVAWHEEGRAPAYALALQARERLLTATWVLSGAWCLEDAPFELELAPGQEPEAPQLRLRLREGLLSATLTVDAQTHLPRRLAIDEPFGGGVLHFEGWREGGGVRLPRRIVEEPAQGASIAYAVQRAGPWTRQRPSFARPTDAPRDTSFAPEASSALEVRRVESGHLFVRPKVDGRELGWFLFDSGLGGSILTRAAAEELELASFGETWVGGFGGAPEPSTFRQGHLLELGPLRIEAPVFIEQAGMGKAERLLEGETCAGALGWDVFLRAIVEVDAHRGQVGLFDPRAYEDKGVRWLEAALHWKVPYLQARFGGDRTGWFALDTGAGGLTVLFHHAAARRLGLLGEGVRELPEGRGARSSFRRGERTLQFEVAGQHQALARVHVSLEEDGEADPYGDGFLGRGLFPGQVFVFDHQRSRVGLRRRK